MTDKVEKQHTQQPIIIIIWFKKRWGDSARCLYFGLMKYMVALSSSTKVFYLTTELLCPLWKGSLSNGMENCDQLKKIDFAWLFFSWVDENAFTCYIFCFYCQCSW